MESLKIISESLGLCLVKKNGGYLLNRGGVTQGIIFDNLIDVAKHLAKKVEV
jgi:hypothetical protein